MVHHETRPHLAVRTLATLRPRRGPCGVCRLRGELPALDGEAMNTRLVLCVLAIVAGAVVLGLVVCVHELIEANRETPLPVLHGGTGYR